MAKKNGGKGSFMGNLLRGATKVVKVGLNVAEFIPGVGTAIKGGKLAMKIASKGGKLATKLLGAKKLGSVVQKVKETGVLKPDKIRATIKEVTGKHPTNAELEEVTTAVHEITQESHDVEENEGIQKSKINIEIETPNKVGIMDKITTWVKDNTILVIACVVAIAVTAWYFLKPKKRRY